MFTKHYKPSPRMIMLMLVGITSALNYAFGVAMGWILTPGDYGLLAFAQALLLVGGMVLHSGLPFISLVATSSKCAQSTERFGLVALLGIAEMSFKVLGGVSLTVLGFGVPGATAGFLVGAFCAGTLGVRQLARSIGVQLRGSLKAPDIRASIGMFGALLGLSCWWPIRTASCWCAKTGRYVPPPPRFEAPSVSADWPASPWTITSTSTTLSKGTALASRTPRTYRSK